LETPVIDITDLSKYYGNARGIDCVNLEIGEGEIFGFIGPNGAGKSTTIRILLNLIFPTGGSARIMGLDVIRDTKNIKQKVGYIPSDSNAYPTMKVVEFLQYCLRFYQLQDGVKRIKELCGIFDLDPGRKIADLSMGNRKKVAIVQSLIHSPKLLILDEPTTGLDPLMQETFFELLKAENQKGMTIFFSSHVLSDVQLLCRKVAIIKEGKIIKLEDIESMRKKQVRKVHLEFEDQVTKDQFQIAGMESIISGPGNVLTFMYQGEVNKLIALLSEIRIVDMILEEPSLEEIFIHFYR